jgi:hypothetical protein
MVIDSQRWKCVEPVPAFLFSLDGVSAVRARDSAQQGWLTVAEGFVSEVRDHHVVVGGEVVLSHSLPACVSLAPLVGSRIRLSLHEEPSLGGPHAQTLVIASRQHDSGAITRLIARFGPAGQEHALGGTLRVRAALSQRPGGPMTFGTDSLQYVVSVGRHVRVSDERHEYVVHLESRTAHGYVAYAIVEHSLWASDAAKRLNGRR